MTDYKYMLQDKIKPGPKAGAREVTYNASEVLSNGSGQVAFPKGYQEPLRNPVIPNILATGTDGGFITKTEIEPISQPMVATQGNNPLSIIQPVVTTVSSITHQSTKGDEYITKTQTEATRPYIKGPVSNFYWWRKPSNSSSDRAYDYTRRNDYGVNKHNTSNDVGMHQQYFDSSSGRTEKALDEVPPKVAPLAKPAIGKDITSDNLKVGTAIVVPTQAQAPPNVVSNAAILVPAIDSREAAKRYGGLSTTPSPVVAYVPAIDSREAAKKYRGQAL